MLANHTYNLMPTPNEANFSLAQEIMMSGQRQGEDCSLKRITSICNDKQTEHRTMGKGVKLPNSSQ